MPDLSPTSIAVASAITHYRELRELSRDELSSLLRRTGHELDVDGVRAVEDGISTATVDDLTAIAHALGITPADLLSHVPVDQPVPEGPIATGVPDDVPLAEYRAWLTGSTALDCDSRLQWHQQLISDLRIRSTHVEDQLGGAREELSDLGVLAIREADMPPVQRLNERVRTGEHELVDVDLALALAEQRLADLQSAGRCVTSYSADGEPRR
ncbi:helix-turn-helix domain-containing protein [Pseudactinotalea sp. Z1732]|uniref:helix-turn-helix domain-containing protein n=1 Tax=Micrococcales TaxID=85006 RepID=UPI003C7C84F9